MDTGTALHHINKQEANGGTGYHMKAAIISLGATSSKWVAEEMRKLFEKVDELDLKKVEANFGPKGIEIMYDGKPIGEYDCIYPKGSFRYSPLLRSIATALHGKSYMPLDPPVFTRGQDKLITQLVLQESNVPMPSTYLAATVEAAKHILEQVNYPIVMKFPQGTQGKGVMFADSFSSASSMLDALSALKQPFLIQEYVETDNVDIRCIVVGKKVVAAMKRYAVGGEKRANIHAGGKGEAFEPDNLMKNIAVKAAEAIGAEICGVDMLESAKGPMVIEVNLSPGLQGITEATKVNVAEKIAKHIYNKSKEFTSKEK
ncbi:MAG: RimK family alpha-L-glutamate ligase, partial [Candidatus Woesearchaeota archaeon]